jgi:hypothetical protein
VFFKGGTSLLKAYKVINRFSEDLDLSVFSGNIKSSFEKEKNLTRNTSHIIIDNNKELYNKDLSQKQFGDTFRKLFFSYDNIFGTEGIKKDIEVEIKCCIFQGEDKNQLRITKITNYDFLSA